MDRRRRRQGLARAVYTVGEHPLSVWRPQFTLIFTPFSHPPQGLEDVYTGGASEERVARWVVWNLVEVWT